MNVSEFVIINVVNDVNGLLIVDLNNFENFDLIYEFFLILVGVDGIYIIYVYVLVIFIINIDFFDFVLEGDVYIYILKILVFNDIIDGNIKKWFNNV